MAIESSDATAEAAGHPMLLFTWPMKNGEPRLLRCDWTTEDDNFLIDRKHVGPGLLSAVAVWATAVAAAELTGAKVLVQPPGTMLVARSKVSAVQLAHVGYWFETLAKIEMQVAMVASSRILPPSGVPMPLTRPTRGN